jgi:hypothetical protein
LPSVLRESRKVVEGKGRFREMDALEIAVSDTAEYVTVDAKPAKGNGLGYSALNRGEAAEIAAELHLMGSLDDRNTVHDIDLPLEVVRICPIFPIA